MQCLPARFQRGYCGVSMSKRTILILAGCVLVALLVTVATLFAVWPRPTAAKAPEIGGQSAPAHIREIDFSRRYDAYCSFFGSEPTVFRGCKVVGFTGPDSAAEEGLGLSSGYGRRYFDRWLVLELSDGRLAYIPPSALKYLEVSKAP